MFRKPVLICIVCITVFLSCGIEEYYFLPQVPETSITSSITNADINIPSIPNDPYFYANSYAIFYRIYASDHLTFSSSPSEFNLISPYLSSDYNYFLPITNPANMSATISANTFRSRNFFELEFEGIDTVNMLPKTGGRLNINFPASLGYPTANGVRLLRSNQLIAPRPDMYFRYSLELAAAENANNNINADVTGLSGAIYAYVAMYIVTVGTHPENFTRIYSKPTFISVFRLP
jgi:hypothetical protein